MAAAVFELRGAVLSPDVESLAKEVDSVYSAMSVRERLAQICAVNGKRLRNDDGSLNVEKAERYLKNGIGHICQYACNSEGLPETERDFAKALQTWMIEKSSSGIPAVMHEEVITGFAGRGATVYPQEIGAACSFDPELFQKKSDEIAQAARAVGCTQALSPMADVISNSNWTRLEEGFGESGYLAAVMGDAFVEGLQRNPGRHGIIRGVGACTKHFLGYGTIGGGESRPWTEIFDEVIYPHEAMMNHADALATMPCYDRFKGVQSITNKVMLTDLLRGYIGFKGVTMSDYGCVKDWGREALIAGNDIDLPHGAAYAKLLPVLEKGDDPELNAAFERAVRNALMLKARLGLLRVRRGGKIKTAADLPLDHDLWIEGPLDLDRNEWRETARKLAEESMVLLKNNGVLPLGNIGRGDRENGRKLRVLLTGPNANSQWALTGDYTYHSMQAFWRRNPRNWPEPHMVTPLEAFLALSTKHQALSTVYARGVNWCEPGDVGVSAGGDPRSAGLGLKLAESADETDFDQAVKLAAESDVIVACMGENFTLCGENRQRRDDRLPGRQIEFVRALCATGKPVVLVVFGGRNQVLDDLADKCAAVIQAWYPGEAGGTALVNLLTGKANFSGKLAMTYQKSTDREPMMAYDGSDTDDRIQWPFGYGLSYTKYEYSSIRRFVDLSIEKDWVEIPIRVKNAGEVKGTEVVEAYVAGRKIVDSSIRRFVDLKKLRAFGRVELEAGEEKALLVRIPVESFGEYENGWIVKPGEYAVKIGGSSRELPIEVKVKIEGERRFARRSQFFGAVVAGEFVDSSIRRFVDPKSGMKVIEVMPGVVNHKGPIHLESNTELRIDEGAELVFSADPADYLPAVKTSWEGTHVLGYSPLIYAYGATNVAITGKGVIRSDNRVWNVWGANRKNGNKSRHAEAKRIQVEEWNAKAVPLEEREWWKLDGSYDRPQLIQFYNCETVKLDGFTVRGSPFWTIHLLESKNCEVRNLDVFADGHNTDGIDIESSENVLVENCVFNQGDDGIVLKSGLNRDGRDTAKPTKNVTIRNCVLNEGHGLLSIGSELSGGIENILLEDCRCDATVDKLLFIKSNPARGGYVKNVTFRRVKAGAVRFDAFAIITNYFWKPEEHVGEEAFATKVEDVTVEDVYAASCRQVYNLTGYEENPIENVTIRNLKVAAPREESSVKCVNNLKVE